jgi:Holliday junction resolvase RusA-like endonuclease
MYNLTIFANPIAASRPRVTRWSTYYKEPYNSYKSFLRNKVIESMPDSFLSVFDASMALKMNVIFEMEIPKSYSNKKRLSLVGTYVIKKPDTDNLIKSVQDGLNGIVYHDDSQIASVNAVKIYSLEPKTIINIKEL